MHTLPLPGDLRNVLKNIIFKLQERRPGGPPFFAVCRAGHNGCGVLLFSPLTQTAGNIERMRGFCYDGEDEPDEPPCGLPMPADGGPGADGFMTIHENKPEEQNMYIMDDGIRLNAKLDMPEKHGEKCPLVIVIHGFTGHMEERHITAVAKTLDEIGYATLRVDMYGHGNSDGKFENHTLFKWLTNALTVIDYARGLDFVTDLYLCGHSQGGMTVMLAGAMKHDAIKGIIPLSPA